MMHSTMQETMKKDSDMLSALPDLPAQQGCEGCKITSCWAHRIADILQGHNVP